MPPRRKSAPRVAELEPKDGQPVTIADNGNVAIAEEPEIIEPSADVFDDMRELTDRDWQENEIYLYRLEPKIKNAAPPYYIDKLMSAVDRQYVKENHGGGMYMIQWKRPDRSVRKIRFSIDGRPQFQPGQTFRDISEGGDVPAATPGAAPAATSGTPSMAEFAQMLKTVLDQVMPNNEISQKAIQNAVDTMQLAQTKSIEMVAAAASRNAGSTTGNALGDKVVDALLTKVLAGGDQARAVDPLALFMKAVDLVKTLQPAPAAARTDGGGALGMLGELKETLGLDIVSLIRGGGKADWKDALVGTLGNAVQFIPQALQYLARSQELRFAAFQMNAQRAAQQTAGTPAAPGTTPAAPAASVPAAPAVSPLPPNFTPEAAAQPSAPGPAAAAPAAAPQPTIIPPAAPQPPNNVIDFQPQQPQGMVDAMQLVTIICHEIALMYEAGTPGDGVAHVLQTRFEESPQVLVMIRQYFPDAPAMKTFAKTNEVLGALRQDAEFDQSDFDQFIEELWAGLNEPGDGAAAPA